MFSNQAVQMFNFYTLLFNSCIKSFFISSLQQQQKQQQQLKKINDKSLAIFQVSIVVIEQIPFFRDITLCS